MFESKECDVYIYHLHNILNIHLNVHYANLNQMNIANLNQMYIPKLATAIVALDADESICLIALLRRIACLAQVAIETISAIRKVPEHHEHTQYADGQQDQQHRHQATATRNHWFG